MKQANDYDVAAFERHQKLAEAHMLLAGNIRFPGFYSAQQINSARETIRAAQVLHDQMQKPNGPQERLQDDAATQVAGQPGKAILDRSDGSQGHLQAWQTFAAAALQGILASNSDLTVYGVASEAASYADAMMQQAKTRGVE